MRKIHSLTTIKYGLPHGWNTACKRVIQVAAVDSYVFAHVSCKACHNALTATLKPVATKMPE